MLGARCPVLDELPGGIARPGFVSLHQWMVSQEIEIGDQEQQHEGSNAHGV